MTIHPSRSRPAAPDRTASTQPRQPWIRPARVGWILTLVGTLALFAAGVPVIFSQLDAPCSVAMCARWQLSPGQVASLAQLGLTLRFYAIFYLTTEALIVFAWCALAALLVWRKPDDPMALFAAFALTAFGGAVFVDTLAALGATGGGWWWAVTVLKVAGSVALLGFFYLFPNGRFVPRWTRWAALGWGGWVALANFAPADWAVRNDNPASPVFHLGVLAFFVVCVGAQIYRYQRISGRAQRQQAKWVVAGFAAAIAGILLIIMVIEPALPAPPDPNAMLDRLIGLAVFPAILLLLPLSIAVAVLRYHLFDIDLVIGRALLYGALTVSVVLIYVLVVGYLGAILHANSSLAISLIGTGVVAVLFQPLREWFQRRINHLVYGDRDDPYLVLSRLGQRLESTLAPESVFATIVRTTAESLNLPYAGIALGGKDDGAVVAEFGAPTGLFRRFPLSHQGEILGELRIAAREPGEDLGVADRRLLDDLARQAGAAIHATRLTLDLQRSRERLVTAREEERRRLRRDLHDGLGPALSSVLLKLAAARHQVAPDAPVQPLLAELGGDVRAVVADVRRLVYDLRPPILDQLGLLLALREIADRSGAEASTKVVVELPDCLPPLPAAVEVAAYRIVQEALANVARHAGAANCLIHLRIDSPEIDPSRNGALPSARALVVEVIDDGVGFPAEYRSGVGVNAMRERAMELGGDLAIVTMPNAGSRVQARLSLSEVRG